MVIELDNGPCVNEDAELPRGIHCEISQRLEKETKHSL